MEQIEIKYKKQDSGEHWFLMRVVGAQKDILVRDQLTKAGMRFYQPLVTKVRKYKDGSTKLIKKPYIAGMFFAYGTYDDVNEQVKASYNVLQWPFVRGGHAGDTTIIPTDEMENFIKVAQSTIVGAEPLFVTLAEAEKFVGKKVRLHGGQLDGVVGRIQKATDNNKDTFVVELRNFLAIEIKIIPDQVELL